MFRLNKMKENITMIYAGKPARCFVFVVLMLYVPVNNFQLCRGGSSWAEPELSRG